MNRHERRAEKAGNKRAIALGKHIDHCDEILANVTPGGRAVYRAGLTSDAEHITDLVRPGDPIFQGCVVNHWLIGGQRKSKKNSKIVHICVSYCGCVAMYEPWEIANGKLPATCVACRVSEGEPAGHATVPERLLPVMRAFWRYGMSTAFEETLSITNSGARADYIRCGRPCLADICDSAGWGRHFGWKVIVFAAAYKPNLKQAKPVMRVKGIFKDTRQIEMMIRPANCDWEYQLNLSTGRADYPFMEIAEKIKNVIDGRVEDGKAERARIDVTATSPPANGHLNTVGVNLVTAPPVLAAAANAPGVSIIDLDKLRGVGGKIERLLKIGADVNEIAAMKLVAQEKIRQVQAQVDAITVNVQAIDSHLEEAAGKYKYLKEQTDELLRRAKNVGVDRDAAEALVTKLKAERASRAEGLPSLEADLAKAQGELAEAERLEADSVKAVGDRAGLEALIAALSKISG